MFLKVVYYLKGYKLEKHRVISLNTNDIKKTVRDLRHIKKSIDSDVPKVIQTLLDEAVNYCKDLTPISENGGAHLRDNVYWIKTGRGYRIVQEGENALYVEFGTGVVGTSSPHPSTGKIGWAYGVGKHIFTTKDGKRGWFYPVNGEGKEIEFTEGQVANMQMYKTGLWLQARLKTRVKMIISREVSKW